MTPRPPPLDPQELRRLYVDENLSIEEVAAHLGCSFTRVRTALHRHGLPVRPASLPVEGRGPEPLDKIVLIQLYVVEGLSITQLAARLDCSFERVRDALHRHRIPVRPSGGRPGKRPQLPLLDREALERLYVHQKLSVRLVAEELGCSARNVTTSLARHGLPVRPRSEPPLGRDVLEDLYVGQALTTEQVGVALGCSAERVRQSLHHHGLPLRARGASKLQAPLTRERLQDLYVDRGLSTSAIAELEGCSAERVAGWLRRHGLPVRPRGGQSPRGPLPPLDPEILVELYLTQGLTVREVAEHLGESAERVRRALHIYALSQGRDHIPSKVTRSRPQREELEALYRNQGLTMAAIGQYYGVPAKWVAEWLAAEGISQRHQLRQPPSPVELAEGYESGRSLEWLAAHHGWSVSTVRRVLQDAGVRLRPPPVKHGPLDAEVLWPLYVGEELSASEVAERLGTTPKHVLYWLRRHGLPVSPYGAGRPKRKKRAEDPPELTGEALEELYVHQRLSAHDVGARLGVPGSRVLDRLVEHGIRVRSRGEWRERQVLPRRLLDELYVQLGLTGEEVAARLGRSAAVVYRDLHTHGLPVRPPGVHAGLMSPVWLLKELYGDPLVDDVLQRHLVPVRPYPGVLRERFPEPVALGVSLLRDLYAEAGVSAFHVELLTGQSEATVWGRLAAQETMLRPPGRLSPFRQRLRDAEKS